MVGLEDQARDDLDEWSRTFDQEIHRKTAAAAAMTGEAHRPKSTVIDSDNYFPSLAPFAAVTKLISKKDKDYHCQGAQEALRAEMIKLEKYGTWAPVPVALRDAKKVEGAAFVRLFSILGLKGSELPDGHPDRKWKGRVVAAGNNVSNARAETIIWEESSSAPTTMPLIRLVMAISQRMGVIPEAADAVNAYVQALLPPHIKVYCHIGAELWTEDMKKQAAGIDNPVWTLRRPIYGLSISGYLWQERMSQAMTLQGWREIKDDAAQTFYKIRDGGLPSFVTIYVDDIVAGGDQLTTTWEEVHVEIETTPPAVVDRVLAVNFVFEKDDEKITTFSCMEGYMRMCVQRYTECQHSLPIRPKTMTPFLELSRTQLNDPALQEDGLMKDKAASILMGVLYAARMMRMDVSFTTIYLARQISRWRKVHDLQLNALMSYILETAHFVQTSVIYFGKLVDIMIHAYCDADLGGSVDCAQSTSGGIVELYCEKGSCFHLVHWARKQSSTAHSTCEAETISLDLLLREQLIPLQSVIETFVSKIPQTVIFEDNAAAIVVCTAGFSSALRYMKKHCKISLSFISEEIKRVENTLRHCPTNKMKGDICTKGLSRIAMIHALELANLGPRDN